MSSESKPVAETTTMAKDASAYLLDIEGTTTSISFVKETLFPYVRKNLAAYLQENWAEASFQEVLKKLVEQSKADVEAKLEGVVTLDDEEESAEKGQEAVKSSVLWMMDSDRKVGALKTLQGLMYKKGYASGELKGHVYSDVVPQFKKWTSDGKKLYIFSSGSVEAQKLLFGHTTEGDVTSMIADYFDTEVGPKVEKESYTKIAEKIGKPVGEIVFYTDVVKEADAAKEAGMPVVVVAREGNAPLTDEEKTKFTVVTTFEVEEAEEVPAKKQKLDEEAVAVEEKAAAVEEKPAAVEEKSAAVEEKSTDVEMKSTETVETEKVNGTNGVHKEGTNGTNGNEEKETNGTNGTEEKKANGTNGTEDKTKGEAVVEAAPEKMVSPIKKVVTEEGGAGDAAPKEVAAE